jgi:putative membrane protein
MLEKHDDVIDINNNDIKDTNNNNIEPYSKFETDHEHMILRDYLAVDRTILTNEATYLAYIRTSLTLFAAGATLVKVFSEDYVHWLGWVFIVIAVWLVVHGYFRYEQINKVMQRVKGEYIKKVTLMSESKKLISLSLQHIIGKKK